MNEYIAQHISASADGYLEGTAGSLTAATGGHWLMPYIKVTDSGGESFDLWSYPEDTHYPPDGQHPSGWVGRTWRKAHYTLDIVADGYYPKLVTFDPDPKLGGIGETGITVMLRKNTDALCQPDINIWTEKAVVIGGDFWQGIGTAYRYAGNFSVRGITNFGIHEKKDLTTKGRNTVTPFSHYANTQSVVLNVTLPSQTVNRLKT